MPKEQSIRIDEQVLRDEFDLSDLTSGVLGLTDFDVFDRKCSSGGGGSGNGGACGGGTGGCNGGAGTGGAGGGTGRG